MGMVPREARLVYRSRDPSTELVVEGRWRGEERRRRRGETMEEREREEAMMVTSLMLERVSPLVFLR